MTEKKQQLPFIIHYISGTIILAGILLAVDFLYAGIQELFLVNINPSYTPDVDLARIVIIGSSISIVVGLGLYILDIWLAVRRERIQALLRKEQIVDQENSLNFKNFQIEISNSLTILKDLFGFILIIVVVSGLFSFFRFIWMIGKYRPYSEFFIHYFLSDTASIIISITLYLTISIIMTYVIFISLQRYNKLKAITESYNKAMEMALGNLGKLMGEEEENQQITDESTS